MTTTLIFTGGIAFLFIGGAFFQDFLHHRRERHRIERGYAKAQRMLDEEMAAPAAVVQEEVEA